MPLDSLSSIPPHLVKKLEYFHSLTIAHPHLLAARDKLMDAIDGSLPGSLILVLGPTGVGKTTLRHKVEHALTQQTSEVHDPGRLPFVSVEAAAPQSGRFRWRDYFAQLLAAANEPAADRKVMLPSDPLTPQGTLTGTQLEQAAMHLLQYRRPIAVFLDEAQHLAKVASGRKLIDQLDVVKSIANRTKTTHVLLGTYELLAFRNLSGQLSRRSLDLHFARYRAESSDDLRVFKNVLLSLQNHWPAEEKPDLLREWEFLYERSIGCVGVLKDWLMRVAVTSLKKAAGAVNRLQLEQTALSTSQCQKILAEAREGETRLTETDESREHLRNLLGLHSTSQTQPKQETPSPPPPPKAKVAFRQPKRDPVGRIGTTAHA
jgi:energy-coupling factor transporter ATP-binding protein EcfA2